MALVGQQIHIVAGPVSLGEYIQAEIAGPFSARTCELIQSKDKGYFNALLDGQGDTTNQLGLIAVSILREVPGMLRSDLENAVNKEPQSQAFSARFTQYSRAPHLSNFQRDVLQVAREVTANFRAKHNVDDRTFEPILDNLAAGLHKACLELLKTKCAKELEAEIGVGAGLKLAKDSDRNFNRHDAYAGSVVTDHIRGVSTDTAAVKALAEKRYREVFPSQLQQMPEKVRSAAQKAVPYALGIGAIGALSAAVYFMPSAQEPEVEEEQKSSIGALFDAVSRAFQENYCQSAQC